MGLSAGGPAGCHKASLTRPRNGAQHAYAQRERQCNPPDSNKWIVDGAIHLQVMRCHWKAPAGWVLEQHVRFRVTAGTSGTLEHWDTSISSWTLEHLQDGLEGTRSGGTHGGEEARHLEGWLCPRRQDNAHLNAHATRGCEDQPKTAKEGKPVLVRTNVL